MVTGSRVYARPFLLVAAALGLAACGGESVDPTDPDGSSREGGSAAGAAGAGGSRAGSAGAGGSLTGGSAGAGGSKADAQVSRDASPEAGPDGADAAPSPDGPMVSDSPADQTVAPDGTTTPDGAARPDAAAEADATAAPDGATAPDGGAKADGATAPDATVVVDASDGGMPVIEAAVDTQDACAMSSPAFNLATGGTATSSDPGDDGAGSVAKAFDDHSGTKWLVSTNPTPWIAYEFGGTTSQVVTTYTITSANDDVGGGVSSDPASWQLQGSHDGPGAGAITWTTLDTRTAYVFTERYDRDVFSFSNATAYHRYRLLVTANGGAAGFQIAELELFGAGTPVFSIDDSENGLADNQFSYSSGWLDHTSDPSSARYGGTTSWCSTTDESATLTFVGSQVRLFAVKDMAHGIVGVSLDGGPETLVDLYGGLAFNQLVYTSPMLCTGRHELTARVTGNKNPSAISHFVSLDRVQVVP